MPGGITFKNGFPQSFTTLTNYSDFWKFQGGNAVTYSDPATGKIIFTTTQRVVFDKNYDTVTNGYGLIGCDGDRYSVQVVPFPSGENKFYIFHSFPETSMLLANESGLQTRCLVYGYANRVTSGLRYSILDMDKNAGLGAIEETDMNKYLLGPVLQRIALVKHANGKDVWLITHFWGSNTFTCFLINSNGIQPPVVSNIGPVFSGRFNRCTGHIDASPDGSKLAATSGDSGILELYDFNNATGTISNYVPIKVPGQPGSVCFSPDNSKLYVGTTEPIICGYRYQLYQLDFYENDLQQSLYKVYESGGSETVSTDMERAVDNKIYVAGRVVYNPTGPNSFSLYTIEYPNQPKNACTVQQNSFLSSSLIPFPNLINDNVKQAKEAQVFNFNFPKEATVCFGTYTLTAPAGYAEYRWSTGETAPSITVTEAGQYFVLAGEKGFSKPKAYGYTDVHSAGKNLNFGKDTAVCPKTEFTLTIPYSFSKILWQDGDTSHIHNVAQTGGKQRVTTIDPNGCKTWDSICVTYKYYPRAEFGKDTTLCNNQSLSLRLEPSRIFTLTPIQYAWQDGSAQETLTITKPGTYWGKVTYDGCTIADTITVTYMNAQQVSLGRDTTLCKGDSLRLKSNISNASYLWSTGETTSSILVKTSGDYWLKVNNRSCTIADTIRVTFKERPYVSLGRDTTLCAGDKLLLSTAISGATYLWQNGSTADSYNVESPGDYWLQLTKDGCTVRDTVTIHYKPLPHLNLGNDTVLCANSHMVLNVSNPEITSCIWQDGSSNPSYTISTKGLYWVKARGINGCYSTDSLLIDAQPLPSFSLGSDTTLCEQQTLSFQYNLSGASYKWSDHSTSNTFAIRQAGMYWLEVKQKDCTKRDSIAVSFKPSPYINLGNDTTLCEGATKVLNAFNEDAAYAWQDGSTKATYTVTAPGAYAVNVSLAGCSQKDTITIAYLYKPRFTLGSDTMLCIGQQILLNPNVPNSRYIWQDGSTTPVYTVSQPGIYAVTVSNACGSKRDEIVITKGLCELVMPNAFTPNNDGTNDVFRVKYPQFIKQFSMTVYNRWGNIVYKSTDAYKGWDGTYNNLDQPKDNYIWVITLTDIEGNTISTKGNVLLIR